MKSNEKSRLDILVDGLKSQHNDYYVKHIGYDFLANLHIYNHTDNISYLMEHVSNLDVTDTVYPQYFQYCYTIFTELQNLVRLELAETQKNYIDLILSNITFRKGELSLLLQLAVNDPVKMEELYTEIKNDTTQWLYDVVLNLIDSYKDFNIEKERKLSHIHSHLKSLLTTLILFKKNEPISPVFLHG